MPSLVLTGDRAAGRHRILIEGTEAWLSSTQFQVLCLLARARLRTRTGYVRADFYGDGVVTPIAICRLRKCIGADTIETGVLREYRLRSFADEITIDPSITELPLGVLPPDLLTDLADLGENVLKPSRN